MAGGVGMGARSSGELLQLFRHFEPLPQRAARNRRRRRIFLAGYVTISSLLVSLSLVGGIYLTLVVLAIRLRDASLYNLVGWFTERLPVFIAAVWILLAPAFVLWCAWVLRSGEAGLLGRLKAIPAPTGDYKSAKAALHEVAIAAGIPVPRLAIIPDPSLNAFVIQQRSESGWIGITDGLAEHLSVDELRAVFGHLASRLQDGSARTATVLAALFSAASGAASFSTQMSEDLSADVDDTMTQSLAKSAVSPVSLLFGMTQFCLLLSSGLILGGHRHQQALDAECADSMGMLITRDPHGMMAALQKVLPADNRPSSVFEPTFRDDIWGGLFFAWPVFSFSDDPELIRIHRMREVLGPSAL